MLDSKLIRTGRTRRVVQLLHRDGRIVAIADQGVSSMTNFGLSGLGLLLLEKFEWLSQKAFSLYSDHQHHQCRDQVQVESSRTRAVGQHARVSIDRP